MWSHPTQRLLSYEMWKLLITPSPALSLPPSLSSCTSGLSRTTDIHKSLKTNCAPPILPSRMQRMRSKSFRQALQATGIIGTEIWCSTHFTRELFNIATILLLPYNTLMIHLLQSYWYVTQSVVLYFSQYTITILRDQIYI